MEKRISYGHSSGECGPCTRGENVMAFAREALKAKERGKGVSATLMAYDLRTGS